MDIKNLREQKHLTQRELSKKAGISIRTLQRIEAGQKPKGYTAKVLAEALNIDLSIREDEQSNLSKSNIAVIKLINLSSLLGVLIPLLNIIIPLSIVFWKKQNNELTKQIISLQIFYTISSLTLFFIAALLKNSLSFSNQFTLWVMVFLILINVVLILINTSSLDKKGELRIKPIFSFYS